MLVFWLSLLIFLGSHVLVSRTALRPWLIKNMGRRAYFIAYSLLSLALLWWLIDSAQNAPRTQIWAWVHGFYWVPNIMMPPAFILLISGFIVANPLSIAPKDSGFDPQKPGLIVATTRHPVLWGFSLWSFSHVWVNGEMPLALMFFIFLLFSVAGIFLIDRKRKRELGMASWQNMARNTHAVLFFSKAFRTGRFTVTGADLAGIMGGLFVYAAFYALHASFFGIDPTPPL